MDFSKSRVNESTSYLMFRIDILINDLSFNMVYVPLFQHVTEFLFLER